MERFVPNLHSGLTKLCIKTSDVGQSNVDSVYYNMNVKAAVDLHSVSNMFLEKQVVTDAAARTAASLRFGCLYNNKLASWYSRFKPNPVSSKCSICPGQDSGSHLVGGCGHPAIKKLRIARHNNVGLLIAKAVQTGALGNDLLVADLCSQSDFKDKLPGVHHSRIPQWVLPAVPARKLAGMRPDLLILRHNIDSLRPDSNNIGAYIVEIKVTNDTSSDKMAERVRLQHKSLLRQFV